MIGVRASVKRVAAQALDRLGVLRGLRTAVLRRRPVVLTYHRVLPKTQAAESWSHPSIIVTSDTFRMQMARLRREFHVLSPPEFVERLENGGDFHPDSCLVTFDDGWLDTHDEAWPVMREFGVPSLVFLSTGFIGSGRMFWQEELGARLLDVADRARASVTYRRDAAEGLGPFGLTGILESGASARRTALDLVRQVKQRGGPSASLRATLARLTEGPARLTVDAFMTWNHVSAMADDGVWFGGHSVTHRLLPGLTDADLREEVAGSGDAIRQHLGRPVPWFAYPNGDWTPRVADAVAAAGYAVAFSTDEGVVDARQRYGIRRKNMHEAATADPAMFHARLAGLY